MLLLAALLAAAPAPPARLGECKWLHGRYSMYLGSSLRRIWVIGTGRMVALYDYDADVPPEIDRYADGFGRYRGVADALYGDFYVCAREPSRPGWMQHVRLVKTRNLIFHGKAWRR